MTSDTLLYVEAVLMREAPLIELKHVEGGALKIRVRATEDERRHGRTGFILTTQKCESVCPKMSKVVVSEGVGLWRDRITSIFKMPKYPYPGRNNRQLCNYVAGNPTIGYIFPIQLMLLVEIVPAQKLAGGNGVSLRSAVAIISSYHYAYSHFTAWSPKHSICFAVLSGTVGIVP